jgi:hypothetical protein
MATSISFPERARRDDPMGHMVVQRNLDLLRDAVDAVRTGEDQGSVVVTSTNTSVVVLHSLGTAAFQVLVTPTNNPGGTFWVTGKTSSQFTLNLQVAAPVGGVGFDWYAKEV